MLRDDLAVHEEHDALAACTAATGFGRANIVVERPLCLFLIVAVEDGTDVADDDLVVRHLGNGFVHLFVPLVEVLAERFKVLERGPYHAANFRLRKTRVSILTSSVFVVHDFLSFSACPHVPRVAVLGLAALPEREPQRALAGLACGDTRCVQRDSDRLLARATLVAQTTDVRRDLLPSVTLEKRHDAPPRSHTIH